MSDQIVLQVIQMGIPPEAVHTVYGDQYEWFQSALSKGVFE
ncbi:hypothetical protein [Advenella alkanexedens]|nr:hypothetical protein [Advenella alkanexedens]WKU18285.1 hypothetical protein Q3V95_08105 [Advenella alkanexedens]